MTMQLILALIFYVCLLPLYFILRRTTRMKKNLVMEVTLPHEAREDGEVLAICRGFRRALLVSLLALTAALVPLCFLPSQGLFLTLSLLWLDGAIALPYLIFALWRRKLLALKEGRGWAPGAGEERKVDLTAAARPVKRLSPLWFLPPLLVSLIPPAATLARLPGRPGEGWMLLVYLIDLALIPLFFGIHRLIYRQASEVVDGDTRLTQALTQARRYQWSRFCLGAAWLTGAFNLGIWLWQGGLGLIVVTLLYCAALLLLSILTELAAQRAQEQLTRASGQGDYVDTDHKWLWGLFYRDPNDRHLVVNNRTGIGTTVNLGRPAGMAIMVFTFLMMAVLPFLGLYILEMERTPVSLSVEEAVLVARHMGTEVRIPLEDIREAELVEELEDPVRVVGNGLETALTGQFQVAGESCTLCLDPTSPPFLRLVTAGGEVYYLGDRESGVTLALYEEVSSPPGITGQPVPSN